MRKGQKLVNMISKYIHPFDLVGQHPCSWNAPQLFNMTDEEFDKTFKGEIKINNEQKR